MSLVTLNQDAAEYVSVVTAKSNTWSHNRRRRRQEQRLKQQLASSSSSADGGGTDGEVCSPIKRIKLDESVNDSSISKHAPASAVSSPPVSIISGTVGAKPEITDRGVVGNVFGITNSAGVGNISGTADSSASCTGSGATASGLLCASSGDEEMDPLVTFSLELRLDGVDIKLSVKLIDGEQKDMLHQILQYIKNRLT